MGEVSCKAVRLLLDAAEGAGISVNAVVSGLPVSLAELRDPARRIDWDVFVDLLDRLDAECADRLPLEELGARILKVPSFHLLRRAGQLFMTPRQLYELGRRFVAPAFFPNVLVTVEWLGSGRLVVEGELLAGYRESVPFFRMCHGNVAAFPRLLDLPDARIEEQAFTGRRGRLVLVPPASHTLAARVRRSARALRALGEVLSGIERHETDLEASLEALRTSRHEMQMLVERLPDGVMVHAGGVVRWANSALAEILGAARGEDLVGKSVTSFVPPEDREDLVLAMRRSAKNEVAGTPLEYRVLRPDGAIRRVQAGIAQLVELDGQPARMVVLRDVTEQHRLREQVAIGDRMASLGALAAGIAHEINNPLAYTRLSLEIAARESAALGGPGSADLRTALKSAREGTERVLAMVHNLKVFSRVHDEPFEAVDLPAVLDATLAIAERAVTAKARLVRAYGPAPLARAQRGKLGQVFLNLLTNAADAIPEGLPPASHVVRITTRTDAQGCPVVEIFDSGCGIAPEVGRRVFDPFFTTKPVGSGTGLGLAVCKRILIELDGTIDFESVPGATTFRVTLPAAPSTMRHEHHGPPGAENEAPRGRVLVVDDEPALLVSIRRSLARRRSLRRAAGMREALAILDGDDGFDAILADLMMTEATGIDLYTAVRQRHPDLASRFLFMTGGAFTAKTQTFLAETSLRILEKPFRGDELMDAVDDVMARTGAMSALHGPR